MRRCEAASTGLARRANHRNFFGFPPDWNHVQPSSRHSSPLAAARLLTLAALLALAGCARTPAPRVTPVPADAGGAAIVAQALDLVGTPYRAGGTSPATGFDCSGLVHYVYRQAVGLELPRTTAGLDALRAPAPGGLQPGDLVLFAIERNDRADHAGIYVGDGTFVHAPSSGGRVRVEALAKRYWQRSYRGARRPLP